ncbi:MAG: hypothetical protein WCK67_09275 [bacterium]
MNINSSYKLIKNTANTPTIEDKNPNSTETTFCLSCYSHAKNEMDEFYSDINRTSEINLSKDQQNTITSKVYSIIKETFFKIWMNAPLKDNQTRLTLKVADTFSNPSRSEYLLNKQKIEQ